MYLAYDYPLLSAFWTMLWIFLWVMWFFLLFKIVFDVFRDDSLSGWGKTGWLRSWSWCRSSASSST